MANGDRNVDLVIRAKNEASKALDAITGALDQLTNAQNKVNQSSTKTTSVLGALGSEIGKLVQQVNGMSAFDRMQSSVTKAASGVAKLEESVSSLSAEQQKLNGDIAKSEGQLAKYQSQSAQLAAQLEQQKAATAEAKTSLRDLTKEIGSGETELRKRVSADRQLEASLLRQETALGKTQQRHRDLTQALLNAEKPSAALIASFVKVDDTLAKQTTRLATTRASYADNRNAVAQLGASLDTLRQQQTGVTTAVEQAKTAQLATSNALKTTNTSARETSKSLTELRSAADNNVAAQERTANALAKARTELAGVEDASNKAGVAIDRIAGITRQSLLRSLADSQTALAKYRTEWASTTAAIAAGMKNQAPGSPLTPELAALIEKAKASKAAVAEMQLAIQQMRTAVREAGTDVVKLAQAEQTFITALGRVKVATDASAAAQSKVNALMVAAGGSAAQATGGMNNLANATNRQASAANQASSAMAQLDGRGRQALSWAQRLRGEVVALATAYIGLFAAIEQLKNVTTTFQTIEAAQSRLLVAFGTQEIAGRELRFIRAEADRLGISLGTLSNEYSKFAIATRGSSLEGEQTRKIFISVSEAARVNKLSMEQIQGTYLALTQMVSKGNVSMEELRQQLGERLYGAFTLAGKAMNLTGAQLTKLIETGGLATDVFLPKFAEQLDKAFGPALPAALQSLTTELGQFSNEIFKAQERVAEGGFVEGLRVALKQLTTFFQSDEGVAFFNNLGAAAGAVLKILAQIPEYATPITAVFSLWAGMKLLGVIQGLGDRFRNLAVAMKPLPAVVNQSQQSFNAFAAVGGQYNATATTAVPLTARLAGSFTALTATLRTSTGAMTAASVAAGALNGVLSVLRGVMAGLGGIPGLVVAGLSVAFTYWMTGTEKATNAVEEHKRQVIALLDTYGMAKDKAGEWAKAVQGVSLGQAEKTLNDLEAGLSGKLIPMAQKLAGALGGTIWLGRGGLGDVGKRIAELTEDMVNGRTTVNAYAKALDEILKDESVDEKIKEVIRANADLTAEAVDAETALAKQGIVVTELGGNAERIKPLIDALGLSIKTMAEAAGVVTEEKAIDPMVALGKQVDLLKTKIPGLKDELKKLEDLKELDEILKTVNLIEGLDKSSQAYKDFLALVQRGQREINEAFNDKQFKEITSLLTADGTGVDLSSRLLKQFESFRPTPYWDVNAYRVGFGSDTVTLADGSIQKVVQGMKVSVEDANRDLVRRIGEFQGTIKNQIGADRFNSFNPQQQAALTSIAYNYGSLPGRILDAVKTGTSEEIANSIRGLSGDNNGINSGRRQQEAAIFQQGPQFNPEGMAKIYEQQLATAQQYHETLQGTLEVKRQEAEADKRISLEDAVQLAITKEENAAKKAGTVLTQQERDAIRANVTEAHAKKQAEWDIADAKKAQVEGEQKIATLQQLRRDLLEQMKFAQQTGNVVAYEQLKTQLTDVTGQLDAAINKMILFWEAAGNSEKAQAAIASLNTLKNSLVKVEQQGILTYQTVGKALGQQMVSGINNFVDKVRETGDVIGAAKEAFLQFAADFLAQIAKMILQQALLNALKAAFGGAAGGGGFWGAVIAGVGGGQAHDGGVVGQSIDSRVVNPAWFKNAARYHTGGIAGLKSNEVPTVLEEGEVIRTVEQEKALARKMDEGGGAAPAGDTTIVNAIDMESAYAAAANSPAMNRTILNIIRMNRSNIKSIIG